MTEPVAGSEHGTNEYEVVSFKIRPGLLSVVCGLLTVGFAMSLDELPFVLGGRLRPYLSSAAIAAVGLNVLGIALGAIAARRPAGRGAGRLGVLVNAVVLVLLVLFMVVFRRIRSGIWL